MMTFVGSSVICWLESWCPLLLHAALCSLRPCSLREIKHLHMVSATSAKRPFLTPINVGGKGDWEGNENPPRQHFMQLMWLR
jgi:hypothetical protein